jgi:hypothetical protein
MFWPAELSKQEAELSVIPELLRTQDQFITILQLDVPAIDDLFQVIDRAELSANMFLKHLVVIADFGGEMIQRLNSQFASFFPDRKLEYIWKGAQRTYQFTTMPIAGTLNNAKLGLSGKTLLDKRPLNDLMKDVIAVLLFGNAVTNEEVAAMLAKCEICNYLGQPQELEQFIKQRYIWVSRITNGSKANNLGQIAQAFVQKYITDHIDAPGITVTPNGHLAGVAYTDDPTKLITFDAVVSNGRKSVAVEVGFQVTTNSTIERKAGQARYRFQEIHKAGHKIAYVLDGAGNFQRENALRTICQFSDCTVAFSKEELDVLCQFIREYFAE